MKQNKHKFPFKINSPTDKRAETTLGIIKPNSHSGILLLINRSSMFLDATGKFNRHLCGIVLTTSQLATLLTKWKTRYFYN